jgi:putative hydrolase of the HAD superfamily
MISPNGITTILFDLDGTLRHSVPNGADVFLDFAESLGAPGDRDSQRRALQFSHEYWANSENLLIDIKTYGRENAEFWENYARRQLEALGASEDQAKEWAPAVHKNFLDNYDPQDTIPDDVYPTLDALREADYKVGLVTNRSQEIHEYMAEIGMAAHLDFYFAAGEIGAWKPNPEIFYYAIGLANAKPEQTLYVGDNYYADILGARRAHLNPVLIDPTEIFPEADCPVIKTIGELKEHLVVEQAGG